MKTVFKIFFLTLFLSIAGFAVLSFFVPASSYAQVKITAAIPGKYDLTSSSAVPGQFVYNIYQYALMVGGILAFGVVVYGGVRYMISAGNPSGQSDAKEWIQAAIMGILLLAGAYFILKVINPNLVNLTLPDLQTIQLGTYSGGPNAPTAPAGTGCAGGTCTTLPNCTPSSHTSCGGAPAMATVLNCMNKIDPSYSVNEGFPPTPPGTKHSDPGHSTGCAVDIHATGCTAVAAAVAAAQQCTTGHVFNEYAQCPNHVTFATTIGNGNIHIDAPKGKGGGC